MWASACLAGSQLSSLLTDSLVRSGWLVGVAGQSLNSNPCRPLTLGLIDKLWQIGHGVSLLCASAESIHTGVRLLDPLYVIDSSAHRTRDMCVNKSRHRWLVVAAYVIADYLRPLIPRPVSACAPGRKVERLWRLGTGRVVDRFRLVQVRAGR